MNQDELQLFCGPPSSMPQQGLQSVCTWRASLSLSLLSLTRCPTICRDCQKQLPSRKLPGVYSKAFLCGERLQENAHLEWKHKKAPVFEKDSEASLATSTQCNKTWHLIITLCIKSGEASQTNSYFWHEIASLAAYPDQTNRIWCQILVLLCGVLAQSYSSCSRKGKKKKGTWVQM